MRALALSLALSSLACGADPPPLPSAEDAPFTALPAGVAIDLIPRRRSSRRAARRARRAYCDPRRGPERREGVRG
ncbi:MAG: hypothetical protein R3A48_17010 [Polyangiales bacterium]